MAHKVVLLVTLAVLLAAWGSIALGLPGKVFEGKPPYKPGSVLGVLVWHDNDGVHLCSSAKGKPRHFNGTITATGAITKFGGHHVEPNDTVTRLSPKKIAFTFKTSGTNDCLVFKAKGPKVVFDVEMAGKPLPPAHVFIGAKGVHPKKNPFVLTKPATNN